MALLSILSDPPLFSVVGDWTPTEFGIERRVAHKKMMLKGAPERDRWREYKAQAVGSER